jgi:hypothetical protein
MASTVRGCGSSFTSSSDSESCPRSLGTNASHKEREGSRTGKVPGPGHAFVEARTHVLLEACDTCPANGQELSFSCSHLTLCSHSHIRTRRGPFPPANSPRPPLAHSPPHSHRSAHLPSRRAPPTTCTPRDAHPPRRAPSTTRSPCDVLPPRRAPPTTRTPRDAHPLRRAPPATCSLHDAHPPRRAPATTCTRHDAHPPRRAPSTTHSPRDALPHDALPARLGTRQGAVWPPRCPTRGAGAERRGARPALYLAHAIVQSPQDL